MKDQNDLDKLSMSFSAGQLHFKVLHGQVVGRNVTGEISTIWSLACGVDVEAGLRGSILQQ